MNSNKRWTDGYNDSIPAQIVDTIQLGNCQAEVDLTGKVELKTPTGKIPFDATPDQLRQLARLLDNIDFQTRLAAKLAG
ncbi:MAG: hypothetical protein B7Z37_21005 [Verrucomicrobia bacterium 12-59-8]|nr:MAG: hypothetical protein B7Z37_21005 [Verrucomicrobia bacterium 12-59-8]